MKSATSRSSGWRSSSLLEVLRGGLDLEHGRDLVARDADDTALLLGERIEDALAHPPNGVGDELEALGVVEPARRL